MTRYTLTFLLTVAAGVTCAQALQPPLPTPKSTPTTAACSLDNWPHVTGIIVNFDWPFLPQNAYIDCNPKAKPLVQANPIVFDWIGHSAVRVCGERCP